MFEVDGIITRSHKEIVDGQEITVVDEFKMTGVSFVPPIVAGYAMSESRDKLESAISTFEAEAYWRGLERGLQIAEKIVGWLTWQPQSKRMAKIEKWARAAIKEGRSLIPAVLDQANDVDDWDTDADIDDLDLMADDE